VPAHDAELVDAWFRLGFGLQHQHAVRTPMPAPTPPPGVTIRAPVRADVPALVEIEMVLPAHQGASPVFSPGPPYTREDAAAEWEESFDDPRFTSFVAERDGVVLGSATGSSITVSSQHVGPARPDRAASWDSQRCCPAGRGGGLGRALGGSGARLGGRRGLPQCRHRLAGHQPAQLAHLAASGLRADVLTAAQSGGQLRMPAYCLNACSV
jgi:hypothetical protein